MFLDHTNCRWCYLYWKLNLWDTIRLSMFNNFNSFKLVFVALTKRYRSLKKGLQDMVISDEWYSNKENNVDIEQFEKETLFANDW